MMLSPFKISATICCLIITAQLSNAQTDDKQGADELVNYCISHHNKKVGRGQCTDLVFYALSDLNKSLYNDARNVDFSNEALRPGDIIHLQWKNNLKALQHYMVVIEVIDGSTVKIAHQNFNNQLKVVYTVYDLEYENSVKKRNVTVYRLVA